MATKPENALEALAPLEGRWCVLRLRDAATGLLAESSGKLERAELGLEDGEQYVVVNVGRTRFFAHVGEALTADRNRAVVALAPGISLEVVALRADDEGRFLPEEEKA